MKKEHTKTENVYAVFALSIFYFVFLGAEYLFDNMIAYVVNSNEVVLAQNYVLGISAIGFCLFSFIDRMMRNRNLYIEMFVMMLPTIICIFVIQQHLSYTSILVAGLVLFLILGILGSAVHYAAAKAFAGGEWLGRPVGLSYAVGLLLQFINNNVINQEIVEAVALSAAISVMTVLLVKNKAFTGEIHVNVEKTMANKPKTPVLAGVLLVVIVALMSCVFVTLDSAVTLVHANGGADIGQ